MDSFAQVTVLGIILASSPCTPPLPPSKSNQELSPGDSTVENLSFFVSTTLFLVLFSYLPFLLAFCPLSHFDPATTIYIAPKEILKTQYKSCKLIKLYPDLNVCTGYLCLPDAIQRTCMAVSRLRMGVLRPPSPSTCTELQQLLSCVQGHAPAVTAAVFPGLGCLPSWSPGPSWPAVLPALGLPLAEPRELPHSGLSLVCMLTPSQLAASCFSSACLRGRHWCPVLVSEHLLIAGATGLLSLHGSFPSRRRPDNAHSSGRSRIATRQPRLCLHKCQTPALLLRGPATPLEACLLTGHSAPCLSAPPFQPSHRPPSQGGWEGFFCLEKALPSPSFFQTRVCPAPSSVSSPVGIQGEERLG